jgi:hypothetical protein
MKASVLVVSLLFSTATLFSQDYCHFPQSHALWNYIVTGSMNPPHEWTVIDSLGQPVTIGSYDYTQVYSVNMGLGIPYLYGGIREDTVSRKIFFNDGEQEIVLYDFSLGIGDSIFYPYTFYGPPYYKIVVDKYTIDINGQTRNMWKLVNSYLGLEDDWIEGIGSVYREGLLYPLKPDIALDASTPYFGCYSHDSFTYINEETCDHSCPCAEWLVAISEPEGEGGGIDISPNPVSDKLTIRATRLDGGVFHVEVYDPFGRRCKEPFDINTKETTMDVIYWPAGMYFFRIYSNSFSLFRKVLVSGRTQH